MKQESGRFEGRLSRLLSLTGRSPGEGLAQRVQALLRTCYITAAGQSTILAFLKPTSPQYEEENSCCLRKQCVFLPPMFSILYTGSLKHLSPDVAAVCGVWDFYVATCYISDISCLLNL